MAEETQVVETVEEQVVPEAKQPQDEKKVYRCRCGRYHRQKVCEMEVRTRS